MRVLVTGGAGFLGFHICSALLTRGDDVIVLDNFDNYYSPALKEKNIADLRRIAHEQKASFSCIYADIFEVGTKYELSLSADALIHLAARPGVQPSMQSPAIYCKSIVEGTAHAFDIARSCGAKALVCASSSSVYGTACAPFYEEDVGQPLSPYAAAKRGSELICSVLSPAYDIPCVCLRYFTVFGPRQRPDLAFCRFAQMILDGDTLPVYGRSMRDYTYCTDAAEATVLAVDFALGKHSCCEIINVGTGVVHSAIESAGLLSRALAKDCKLRKYPERKGDIPLTQACIAKAHSLLGFSPMVDFNTGIKYFAQWYLS